MTYAEPLATVDGLADPVDPSDARFALGVTPPVTALRHDNPAAGGHGQRGEAFGMFECRSAGVTGRGCRTLSPSISDASWESFCGIVGRRRPPRPRRARAPTVVARLAAQRRIRRSVDPSHSGQAAVLERGAAEALDSAGAPGRVGRRYATRLCDGHHTVSACSSVHELVA